MPETYLELSQTSTMECLWLLKNALTIVNGKFHE